MSAPLLAWWPIASDVPVLVALRLGLYPGSIASWLGRDSAAVDSALERLHAQGLAVPIAGKAGQWKPTSVGRAIAEPALQRMQESGEVSNLWRAYEGRAAHG